MPVVSLEIAGLQWRKARRSAANGACVELAAANGKVIVRDTKDRNGPFMGYSSGAWRSFVADARMGRFDLDRL
jgi:hypothetical protein